MRPTRRFYLLATAAILVVASGYVAWPLFTVGRLLLLLLAVAVAVDAWLLFGHGSVTGRRDCAARFSNGDANRVTITLQSSCRWPLRLQVIDEVPFVFQRRDVCFAVSIGASGTATLDYELTPTVRGNYGFGLIRVFATTRIALVERRFTCGQPLDVKVYPSYLMLRRYELLAMSNNLQEMGIKRVRRIGNNTEFEQIKDYVPGDDYRTINWRATARRHQLMVNVYQDERSQAVVSVIDKGRMMQQAHRGMTLLDYSINASLVLSYVAVRREDRAGLATFSDRFDTFVPPSRQPGQMQTLQEALYAEQTTFGESDFSALVTALNRRLSRRTLLLLFTSFTGMPSLRRQLPYLRQLAQRHRLLVIFFEDMEQQEFIASPPTDVEDYYQHVIAEKFAYEQRLIVQTLRRYGIDVLLSAPQNLSVGVINKYLELRKRG